MLTSLYFLAFIAGILSFLSPCIIPMLGVYFSLITGLSTSQLANNEIQSNIRRRVLANTLAFVIGFGIVFTAAGALAGELGSILQKWQGVLNILGGSVILILALKLLGVFKLPFLNKLHWEPKYFEKIRHKASGNPITSFIVGVLFSIACSHCIGPTLYSILAVAGATQSWFSGMVIMAVFSIGLAIPYILAGLSFGRVLGILKRTKSKQAIVERIAGLLMLYFAYIIYTNQLTDLTGYLARILPQLPFGM